MAVKTSKRVVAKKSSAPSGDYVQNNISRDELIPVMSLIDYRLALLPQNQASGRAKYLFEFFGDKKLILYEDILVIIENYRSFMEQGFFIILDERVVNRHGLQEMYSKILTKESIDKILTGSSEAFSLYKSCSKEQQRLIVGMITRKLSESPDSIDLNVVSKISKESGINIQEKAVEMKENFSKRNKEEEG